VIGWVRFALFALLFGAASVPIYLGTAAAELLWPGAVRLGVVVWGRVFRVLVFLGTGLRMRVVGRVPRGAVIVAAKHQSMLETLALLDVLDSPAIVLKHELLAIPLWRFFVRRHGAMPIDREQGPAAMRSMIRTARAAAHAGRVILIFPEGTRVRSGEAPPLKPGVSALYQLLRLPVVPLALDTGDFWPSGGRPRAGVATLAFGDPIPPGLARDVFEARLHAAINVLQAPGENA
jgi:1-acyl-sn-glycerol-3-phosphate acyltransferase